MLCHTRPSAVQSCTTATHAQSSISAQMCLETYTPLKMLLSFRQHLTNDPKFSLRVVNQSCYLTDAVSQMSHGRCVSEEADEGQQATCRQHKGPRSIKACLEQDKLALPGPSVPLPQHSGRTHRSRSPSPGLLSHSSDACCPAHTVGAVSQGLDCLDANGDWSSRAAI